MAHALKLIDGHAYHHTHRYMTRALKCIQMRMNTTSLYGTRSKTYRWASAPPHTSLYETRSKIEIEED